MPDPGRPTKLTPEVRDKIVQALGLGNYRQDAAAFARVGVATLRRWLARGVREKEGEYARLYDAVTESEARCKITAMGCITKAARDGDWRAGAWYLQRKYPHQFSEQSQLFLFAKAFEQIEAAAEASGRPISDSVWDAAWTKLAQDYASKIPGLSNVALDSGTDDIFDQIDLSEDERGLLLKIVRAAKAGRPSQALLSPSDEDPQQPEDHTS